MKNHLFYFFLFLFLQSNQAQDWALFPEGQKTYWEADGQIQLYYNDVTLPGSFTDRHYFGAEYLTEDSAFQCYKDILEYEYQLDEAPIDSVFSTPFYWFDFLGNDEIRFYQFAEPGESWTNFTPSFSDADSIIFSCISKSEKMFFGVTDSVKIFTLKGFKNGNPTSDFDNIEYQLSKKYGLLKFTPFRMLGGQMTEYNMLGFEDGQEHGFTSSWKNFFGEFQTGQIMKWWDIKLGAYTPPGFGILESFYIDSIISVNFTDSKVTLNVEQYGTRYYWKPSSSHSSPPDSVATFSENKNISHSKGNYELTLSAPPGWFNLTPPEEWVSYQTQHDFAEWGLPTISYDDFNYRYDSTSMNCDKFIADPAYINKALIRGLGITHQGLIGGFTYFIHLETKLLGYGINGEYFGDVVNPVFSRPAPNLSFKLFPNPTKDELTIVFPGNINGEELELKLTDVAGNIILQKNIKNGLGKLEVSAFPAGIYFVVLNGEGVFGRERFVKF